MPVNVTLSPHILGDEWPGIPTIGPVIDTVTGMSPSDALKRVRFLFRMGSSQFVIDSQPGSANPLVIISASNWEARVPSIDRFLSKVGVWTWTAKFWRMGAESPRTLYQGRINVI